MESQFGRDFSGVRIHEGPAAERTAEAVNAKAYTVGQNIVFARGQYAPGTTEGRRLIAHELAHTVQQTAGNNVRLQRKKGDLPDLNSPRFAGDPILEEVFDGERVLRPGAKGEHVRKIQSALIDAGFPLPKFGADADYGSETKTAVENFQRSTGLIPSEVDGRVGEITLSRLDSRFPRATSSGAPAECDGPTLKVGRVDFVKMRGAARDVVADLEKANQVYRPCCVQFTIGQSVTVPDAESDAMLGGDTDMAVESAGRATRDELTTFNGAVARFGLTSRIKVFYVVRMTPTARGHATSGLSATGVRAPLKGMIVIETPADLRTFPHELGHVMFNTFAEHSVGPDNIMHITPGSTGRDTVAPGQCDILFAQA
jgi:hypothetical protein